MRYALSLFIFLLGALPALAAESDNGNYTVWIACFSSDDTVAISKEGDSGASVTFDMIVEGRCAGAAIYDTDWEAGTVQGGIRTVQAHPYVGYRLDEIAGHFANGSSLPRKQVMHVIDIK